MGEPTMRTKEINFHLDHKLSEILKITIDELDKMALSDVEMMRETLFRIEKELYEEVANEQK